MSDLEAAVARGQVCCYCRSADEVEADHVRPRHAGSRSIPAGLAPLCHLCNIVKSCLWPDHGYHPWPDHDDPVTAAAILVAELAWLAARHPAAEIDAALWDGTEPGYWAFRLRTDGIPCWLADFYPNRYAVAA